MVDPKQDLAALRTSTPTFSITICVAAILSPWVYIAVYMYCTYSRGETMFSNTITDTALKNPETRYLAVGTTAFYSVLCTVLFICRFIQIRVASRAQERYSWIRKALNRGAVALTVAGFFCNFMMAIFLEHPVHSACVGLGLVFVALSILFFLILTIQNRKGRQPSYWDVVMQFVMLITSTISSTIGATFFYMECVYSEHSQSTDPQSVSECVLSAHASFLEWVGFLTMNGAIFFFAVSLYRDIHADRVLAEWWQCRWAKKTSTTEGEGGNVQSSNV